jgi:hypothetical protein
VNKQLILNVEAFIGLTGWSKTTEQPPPFLGWWETRREDVERVSCRRWWNGHHWSKPVWPDMFEEADRLKTIPAGLEIQPQIEWCGLNKPHPDGYDYPLVASARLWRALHGKFLGSLGKKGKP